MVCHVRLRGDRVALASVGESGWQLWILNSTAPYVQVTVGTGATSTAGKHSCGFFAPSGSAVIGGSDPKTGLATVTKVSYTHP